MRRRPAPEVRDTGGPLLEVENLRTYFETRRGLVKAVDGVSFDLGRGRTLAIVGESGSGKTVLSRSVMGLLPQRNVIREGQARFAGLDMVAASPEELRQLWGAQVAMVFQDPVTSLNPVVRIGRQISESLRHHLGMGRREARAATTALLRSVGIPEPEQRLRWYPHQFSGGMCQRIVIASAIACGPQLLLADEPTTGLDVTVAAQILDLLQRLQRERQMSMIIISHDLGLVAGRADDIVVMYAGKVVEKAPTPTLLSQTRMPYTEALLRSAPRLSDESHGHLATIPGAPPDPVDYPRGCRFAARCAYAQPRCVEEEPPLRSGESPEHLYACWYPVGTPLGAEALELNRSKAGPVPAAAAAQSTGGSAGGSVGGSVARWAGGDTGD